MPLVVLSGIPSSGKSTRAAELKEFLENAHKKVVHIICENEVMTNLNLNRNFVYANSAKEKELRGVIKSQTERLLGKDEVVIIDALNYIKGYRYEIYAISKHCKTTQCTVQCETPENVAWEWNCRRQPSQVKDNEQYSKEVFDALLLRYESPDSRNRWDSPLFLVPHTDPLPFDKIAEALFDRKPPPPNQSTQNAPLSDTNYLHQVDKITQDVVSAILSAQNLNVEGDIKIPGHLNVVVRLQKGKMTAAQLGRLRRQFLTYYKMHASSNSSEVAAMFAQYLSSTAT